MKTILAVIALASMQDQTVPAVAVEPPPSFNPVTLTLDVAPGYRRQVSLSLPESGVIEVQIESLRQDPSQKWKPTAYISLESDDAPQKYYLNLSVDTDLQQQYVRARLIDIDRKEELSNLTHPELFSLASINTLKIEISANKIRSYVNGTLVESRELPYEPQYFDLGASSGAYKLIVVEPIPAPAPE